MPACAAFLLTWGAGLLTLAPGCPHGDSGETAAVALLLGIAHPPGYPLPTLLGKLFVSIMGCGTVAWRVSLLSLAGAAAAAGMVAAVLKSRRPNQSAISAAALGLVAGLSLEMWNQMTLPKGGVYTISIALLGSLALFASRMRSNPGRMLPSLGLAAGLALGGHYLIVLPCLVFLPVSIYLALRGRKAVKRTIVLALFAAAVGSSVYIYLPLRAGGAHPAFRWGQPDSFARFRWLVFRSQYASVESQQRGVENKLLFLRFASRFRSSLGIIGVLALGLGVASAVRRREWWLAALAGGGGFEAVAAAAYPKLAADALWVADPFFSASWYLLALLACAGLAELGASRFRRAGVLMWAAILLILAQEIRAGASGAAKDRDYTAWDDNINVLSTVQKDSLLFLEGDAYIAPMLYGMWVDGSRLDVKVVTRIFLHFDWGLRQFKDLYSGLNLRGARPWAHVWLMARDIMEDNPRSSWYYALTTPEGWPFGEYALPEGMVYRISPDPLKPAIRPDAAIDRKMFRYRMRGKFGSGPDVNEAFGRVSLDNYVKAFFLRATMQGVVKNEEMALRHFETGGLMGSAECYLNAGLIYFQRGQLDAAERSWRKAAALRPDLAQAHANLGVIALRHRRAPKEAIEHCERAIQANPKLAKSYEVLAGAWVAAGFPEKALFAINRGIEASPDSERLRILRKMIAGRRSGSSTAAQ